MDTKVFYISKNTALMNRWEVNKKIYMLFLWLKMYIFCAITQTIVGVTTKPTSVNRRRRPFEDPFKKKTKSFRIIFTF